MSDIRAKSIPTSLEGKDMLVGASRTGGGKTLAILASVLDILSTFDDGAPLMGWVHRY